MRKSFFIWISLLCFALFSSIALARVGGPDSFGYHFVDSLEKNGPSYQWIDISKTGTPIKLGNFSMTFDIPIGFKFQFYGKEYTTLRCSSAGFLTFKKTSLCGAAGGEPIPTKGGLADNFIAAFWDNLKTGT